eukprot:gnl/TRDRNA2_/TRDRNA2_194974_c0_seq1.p1 gnl/TRDRNA2_/TRDRNA2_194974_c0~~gnl/TRDRNA2_/TRDRNA2_194974_c0_seq1.p1  ORF type:complete len:165 (-),score=49.54 gnl/TRDRNA2_/TRDRNA2_194974_c0_seq1:126-575(-)
MEEEQSGTAAPKEDTEAPAASSPQGERSRSRSPRAREKGFADEPPEETADAGENGEGPSEETSKARARAKRRAAELDEKEMEEMEKKWAAADAAKKAARVMQRQRHTPPRFRDGDGDEANEFLEEQRTASGKMTLVVVTAGLQEVFPRQ